MFVTFVPFSEGFKWLNSLVGVKVRLVGIVGLETLSYIL